MTVTAQIEGLLRSHRLPGLGEGLSSSRLVFPSYESYSLVNLPATIAALLGAGLEGAMPPLPSALWSDLSSGVRRVVLVLVDSMGHTSFQRILENGSGLRRLAQAGRLFPLSSVFPTSTVTSLPSLWTGTPPIAHGLLGPESWERAVNEGLNWPLRGLIPPPFLRAGGLLLRRELPKELVSEPNLGPPLVRAGVRIILFFYLPPPGNGLPRLLLQGVKRFPLSEVGGVESFIGFGDFYDFQKMGTDIRNALVQHRGTPLFLVAYWSPTDLLGHLYGPEGEPFQRALHCLDRMVQWLLDALPPAAREGTLLLLTADHGMTQTPPERAVRLADHPALARMLRRPPGGEPRAVYLHVRPGQAESLRAYIADHLSDRFLLLETERALAAGLFGPNGASAPIREELGQMLLVALDDTRLIFQKEVAPLYGQHGGLSPEEMLVPLLMVRLDGEI